MPSQPTETPDQDLAHVIQFAQLAALVVCDGRRSAGKRNIILTIEAENNLLDLLQCIEERAKAATAKLSSATSRLYPPMEQIAREDAAAPTERVHRRRRAVEAAALLLVWSLFNVPLGG